MLIDTTKKGTIILSHYRSGGTQLKSILLSALGVQRIPSNYIGEIDFDETRDDFYEQFHSQMTHVDGIYDIILLNNPVVIAFLHNNRSFEKLKQDYNIIMLERKNKENVLLSLVLWQHLITEGLYKSYKLQTPEAMKSFHEKMLLTKIPANQIYLGTHTPIAAASSTEWMNTILRIFTYEIQTIHDIQREHELEHVYYEEYESSKVQFKNKHFKEMPESFLNNLNDTQQKIPYYSKNYIDYYEPIVGKMMHLWNIDKL
jgi:hypothetical protein